MLDRILVPLDGTDFAERALTVAVSLARRSGGSLALATVEVPPPIEFPDVNMVEPLADVAHQYLESVAEQIREAGAADVSVAVLSGDPPEALERHREAVEAGMTVMTTHGRSPLDRAWMGSVADTFVRSTGAPVLFLRPAEEEGETDLDEMPGFGHIAVTLDGSELSETAVDPALVLADLFESDVTLVRVVEYPHATESVYIPDAVKAIQEQHEDRREAAHAELEKIAARLSGEGRRVRRETDVVNHSAMGILQVVGEIGADLVVMASHGRGGLSRVLLGSVADKVLRASKKPVMIVPAER